MTFQAQDERPRDEPTPPWPGTSAVDVHHHAIFPGYREELAARGIGAQPGIPLPDWTPEGSLRWMDGAGVERALLSVASPGFYFGDQGFADRLAAVCNRELAAVRDRWPDRFGVLAAVPLPSVASAVAEVGRALDAVGFDGVALLTQYGGRQLGSPEQDEFLALLDARGAAVHVHPTIPEGWPADATARPSLVEYPFETTRAFVSLAANRVFTRFPAIRWVFSHGGGTVPFLADRLTAGAPDAPVADGDSLAAALARSWFDAALTGPVALRALADVAGPGRILFGSDLPFVDAGRAGAIRAAFTRVTGQAPAETVT